MLSNQSLKEVYSMMCIKESMMFPSKRSQLSPTPKSIIPKEAVRSTFTDIILLEPASMVVWLNL